MMSVGRISGRFEPPLFPSIPLQQVKSMTGVRSAVVALRLSDTLDRFLQSLVHDSTGMVRPVAHTVCPSPATIALCHDVQDFARFGALLNLNQALAEHTHYRFSYMCGYGYREMEVGSWSYGPLTDYRSHEGAVPVSGFTLWFSQFLQAGEHQHRGQGREPNLHIVSDVRE